MTIHTSEGQIAQFGSSILTGPPMLSVVDLPQSQHVDSKHVACMLRRSIASLIAFWRHKAATVSYAHILYVALHAVNCSNCITAWSAPD